MALDVSLAQPWHPPHVGRQAQPSPLLHQPKGFQALLELIPWHFMVLAPLLPFHSMKIQNKNKTPAHLFHFLYFYLKRRFANSNQYHGPGPSIQQLALAVPAAPALLCPSPCAGDKPGNYLALRTAPESWEAPWDCRLLPTCSFTLCLLLSQLKLRFTARFSFIVKLKPSKNNMQEKKKRHQV